MSNVKIILNSDGVVDLLKSAGVNDVVEAEAKGIAQRAGNSKVKRKLYKKRGRSLVVHFVKQDMTSGDMEDETLQRAVNCK